MQDPTHTNEAGQIEQQTPSVDAGGEGSESASDDAEGACGEIEEGEEDVSDSELSEESDDADANDSDESDSEAETDAESGTDTDSEGGNRAALMEMASELAQDECSWPTHVRAAAKLLDIPYSEAIKDADVREGFYAARGKVVPKKYRSKEQRNIVEQRWIAKG